jgi:hypothetical protein
MAIRALWRYEERFVIDRRCQRPSLLRLLSGSTAGAFRQEMPAEQCAPPLRHRVEVKRADERRDVLGAAPLSLWPAIRATGRALPHWWTTALNYSAAAGKRGRGEGRASRVSANIASSVAA